ncbi:Regulatory protein BlaR1 [Stieleria neptunia]|uniref:Regulatory protein BlaR1 n=1 Tax=Stieleria neptunia TaxID=2527979 RepID=A0A518I418_9BACT|nr:M56 family metallopeptidase [Stieleria neptunia]QDV47788.1 Regulatory protein BlaR1 [Stieleria neptunia]
MMSVAAVIIGNLCLASLIGVLAWTVGRHGRRAALAHALWIMFFAKLITPPIVSIPLPIPSFFTPRVAQELAPPSAPDLSAIRGEADTQPTPAAGAVAVAQVTPQPATPSAPKASAARTALSPSSCLICAGCAIWLGGFLALVAHGIIRLVRFRRLIGQCGVDDAEATETVRQFVRHERRWNFGRRTPRVVRVSVHVSPMLFGFATRPIIVCPEALWQSLSPSDRRSFLAHETAHFLRRDHWVRWLEWSVSAVYWWFPVVYFAQKQLERHEEACCDAWAVKILDTKPRHYAEALLRVVDFISDHETGLPGFASGMQPTATLEERLRLLMRNELEHASSRLHSWGSGLACAAIWMVHPEVYSFELPRKLVRISESVSELERTGSPAPITPHLENKDWDDQWLPAAPSGFWNAAPIRDWGRFSFDVSGYRLSAIAGEGFIIEGPAADPIAFDRQSMTAIAEIPASGRVIIGDALGNVRLWDLSAGMPVSLLGRHAADVTSLAVTPDGGVFSADSSGTVIRWELQSGRTLARWTSERTGQGAPSGSFAIQSIRSSLDGQWLAVLCGDWRQASTPKTLSLLDSQTLTVHSRHQLAPDTALVLSDQHGHWNAVSWNGTVRSLDDSAPIRRVEKHCVSALVLSQHAVLATSDLDERPADSMDIVR